MPEAKFEPIYFRDRMHIASYDKKFIKEKLNIINPSGHAGIVTLWNDPDVIWEKLLKEFPRLLDEKSPLVALTSLYGNGIPQMLANLAANPHIEYLAITGNDTPAVPSSKYFLNFLQQGIEPFQIGKVKFGRVIGTSFPIDPQLTPELFRHLKVERFKTSELEKLVNFVSQTKNLVNIAPRQIKLYEPEFKDYPSNITTHQIKAETPLEAWVEVMHRLDRFGKNIVLAKGKRRALFNLDVHIANPSPERDETLKSYGFDPLELIAYREGMLSPDLPPDTTYTYGNRLRKYFNIDSLEKVVEGFLNDHSERRAYISLWDTAADLRSRKGSDSSVPCLTYLYFVNLEGKLMLTAGFRTHNAVSAWLLNLYGLRGIQEYVARRSGLESGKINVKSGWIGIDPDDAKTASAMEIVKKYRKIKLNINDPIGYFVIGTRENRIFADHFSQDGRKLFTYTGDSAKDIKDRIRQDVAVIEPDHAIWIGYELAKAHYELHKELPEL